MYEAYATEEIVSKLPLEASAIAYHSRKDKLFIGSKQGHLLSCNLAVEGNRRGYEYQVCRTFEKRPIVELRVVESHDLILCLTDYHLSIHDSFEPYRILHSFTKYKPISALSHYVLEEDNLLFVAIFARKRLHMFKWLKDELDEMSSFGPINLSENAQSITWCGRANLMLSTKGECQFWEIALSHNEEQTGSIAKQTKQLETVRFGSNEFVPLTVFLSTAEPPLAGVCRENNIVDFYEANTGKMATDYNSCKFSDTVLALAYQQPYLIGILKRNLVEIRAVKPPLLIQKIPLLKASMLCLGARGSVYVANESQAWKLSSEAHVHKHIQFLIEEKQFELAAQLSVLQNVTTAQQATIKRQMASKYFSEWKFSKCFEIHTELKTDVLLVLNFFPFLIPEKYTPVLSRYPQSDLQLFEVSLENITENERKYGIQVLIQYLVARRAEHIGLVNQHYLDRNSGHQERILSTNELKRNEASLELIDTVLLKCYIKVNPTMVGPLLRTKNCCCIVSEAEKDMHEHQMYEELLILYERKKMYRKYLELLQREVKKREHFGLEKLVNFLKRLKHDQLPLVLEFASPILSENLELGIQIFTTPADDREIDARHREELDPKIKFDRETILHYLKQNCLQGVIPYLEHVIYKWNDERPRFHDELLEQYIVRVRELLDQYMNSLSSANPTSIVAKSEDDELSICRKKLQHFLETNDHFTIEKARNSIGDDEYLLEERAIILGRIGRHIEALKIYTDALIDFNAAEHHCHLYYNEKNPITSKLFFDLFHYYIMGLMPQEKDNQSNDNRRKPNLTEALRLFKRHPTKIDTVGAFELIPSNTWFNRICEAVKALFETTNNQLTTTNLIVSLKTLLVQKTKQRLMELRRQRIIIHEGVECQICKRKIMNSAFIRNRDHSISHFFCFKTNAERQQQQKVRIAAAE